MTSQIVPQRGASWAASHRLGGAPEVDALADGAPGGQGEHAAARARFVDDAIGGGEPPLPLAASWSGSGIRPLMYPDTACRLLAGGGGGDDGLAAINFRERAIFSGW